MLSCQRCKQSTNGPQAFLLTCRTCNKTWHHRCHMPPVEDVELFQRLRATNAQDMANGIYAWACRRCKKSGTPSGGRPTESSLSLDDGKSLTSARDLSHVEDVNLKPASVARLPPYGINVELSTVVDALNDREISNGKELVDEALVERTLTEKKETMAARKLPYVQDRPSSTKSRDIDVDMLTPPEEKTPSQNIPKLPSHQVPGARMVASVDTSQDISKNLSRRVSGARKAVGTVTVQGLPKKLSHQISGARKIAAPLTHSEDDVEMTDDTLVSTSSESTPGPTLHAPQTSSLENRPIVHKSTSEMQPDARATSSSDKREQEMRSADQVVPQPQGNQDVVDDPEDLYGPPVERRVIRILPSLADELKDQQRRAALQKEEKLKRANLAPDWIYAKYANDPSWKPTTNERQSRRPRKGPARKLEENGLNLNGLMDYFTTAQWMREHRVDKT